MRTDIQKSIDVVNSCDAIIAINRSRTQYNGTGCVLLEMNGTKFRIVHSLIAKHPSIKK